MVVIEDANFGGTHLGDGLIEALAGKPGVWRVFCGDGVTDAGLARLRDVPRLGHWHGGERRYALLASLCRCGSSSAKICGSASGRLNK